jgi:transcriptional regulator with XRE-family HTH domain
MAITAGQCRAARALLNWSQGELCQRARVDQKSLSDFERGVRNPHPRTVEALIKSLEDAGVVFIEDADAFHSGVALKKGIDVPLPGRGVGAKTEGSEQGGVQAEAWDDGIDALHEEALPAVDPGIEELRTYWRANPEKWAAMHKSTRWALLDEMGLRQL